MNSIILILGRSRNSGANAPVGTTFTRKMIKKNVLHNELQVKNDICNSLAEQMEFIELLKMLWIKKKLNMMVKKIQ